MQKKVMSGLAGLLMLSSCSSIKPHGSIDVSYVPWRFDEVTCEDQIKVELDSNLELELNNISFVVGGTSRTYADLPTKDWTLNPVRQEWDSYARLFIEQFELYAFHRCSHGILGHEERWVKDKDNNEYYINYDGITELGLKYKW